MISSPYDFSSPAILLSDVKSTLESSGGSASEVLAVVRASAIDKPEVVIPTISLEEFISQYLAAIAAVFSQKKETWNADNFLSDTNLERVLFLNEIEPYLYLFGICAPLLVFIILSLSVVSQFFVYLF